MGNLIAGLKFSPHDRIVDGEKMVVDMVFEGDTMIASKVWVKANLEQIKKWCSD